MEVEEKKLEEPMDFRDCLEDDEILMIQDVLKEGEGESDDEHANEVAVVEEGDDEVGYLSADDPALGMVIFLLG